MITKVLVSAAIALGAVVGIAGPALADPTPDPAPFAGINCAPSANCQRPMVAPGDNSQMTQPMQRGLSDVQTRLGQR